MGVLELWLGLPHMGYHSGQAKIVTGVLELWLGVRVIWLSFWIQKILLTFWKHKNRNGCSANAKIVIGILEQRLGVPVIWLAFWISKKNCNRCSGSVVMCTKDMR